MGVKDFKDETFSEEVLKSDKIVLVDCYAVWCGPCKMQGPIIDEIAEENDDILVGKLDVDNNPETAIKYGIMSIPTLLIIKNGEVIKQFVGLTSKSEILDALK